MTVSPRVTHNLVTPQLAALQLSPACATFISIKHNTVFAFVYNPLMTHPTPTTPVILCFTITTTTGTLYAFRLVSDNKKRNFGHHHKQCCNFVMKP